MVGSVKALLASKPDNLSSVPHNPHGSGGEGRKDQLLDADFGIYLEHFSYCLFAKHDFTCYLKWNDPEKELKLWVIALNLLTAAYISVKSCSLAHPTLWF